MTKKQINENSLKNLDKRVKFTKDNQPSNECKSEGKINESKTRNILYTLRTETENCNLIKDTVKVIAQEVANGDVRNALKLLGIVKENEVQEIKNTGSVEIQKVFVTKEEQKEIDKNIDDIINGKEG